MPTPRVAPKHVIVVGAGMVGLSTAWFLQSEGVEVTVVDREGVAAGSSWGNAGWLSPALTLPLPDPAILASGIKATMRPDSPVYVPLTANWRLLRFLLQFARNCRPGPWRAAMRVFNEANARAADAYDALADPNAHGAVREPLRKADPFLAAFGSEADRQTLIDEFDNVTAAGGSVEYELIDRDTIHALEPAFGAAVDNGIRIAGQRFIHPGRFVHAVAVSVEERGGTIIADHTVTAVEGATAGATITLASGEQLRADAVVMANGTWLSELARPHGVRSFVQAGRGYSFTVHPEAVPHGPVYFPVERVACTPLGDGALRVAGMMEFRRPQDRLDPRRIDAIVAAAKPMLADVDWDARSDEWVGSRPCTADGIPLVGRTRTANVYVAGGHGMWGIALGPLSGQLLTAQMVRGDTPELLRAFNPLR